MTKTRPERGIRLPPGYRLEQHVEVRSTNSLALERAATGTAPGLWIVADRQTSGRGRAGRSWVSPSGNLYASLLLSPQAPLRVSQQLSLVSGLAVFDAVAEAMGSASARGDLRLKWPNDLLVGKCKLCGILVESSGGSGPGNYSVVMGIGINIAEAPETLDREATCLSRVGVSVSKGAMMELLAHSMADWLATWREGAGIAEVRQAWLERGPAAGEPIVVRRGSERLEGHYDGLDVDGALRLLDPTGAVKTISTGEVVRPAPSPELGG